MKAIIRYAKGPQNTTYEDVLMRKCLEDANNEKMILTGSDVLESMLIRGHLVEGVFDWREYLENLHKGEQKEDE